MSKLYSLDNHCSLAFGEGEGGWAAEKWKRKGKAGKGEREGGGAAKKGEGEGKGMLERKGGWRLEGEKVI